MPILSALTGKALRQKDPLACIVAKAPLSIPFPEVSAAAKLVTSPNTAVVISFPYEFDTAVNQINPLAQAIVLDSTIIDQLGMHSRTEIDGHDKAFKQGSMLLNIQMRLREHGLTLQHYTLQNSTKAKEPNPEALRRDALMMGLVHLSQEDLGLLIAVMEQGGISQAIDTGKLDSSLLDLQRSPGKEKEKQVTVSEPAYRAIRSLNTFMYKLPVLGQKRVDVQRFQRLSPYQVKYSMRPLLQAALKYCISTEDLALWDDLWNVTESLLEGKPRCRWTRVGQNDEPPQRLLRFLEGTPGQNAKHLNTSSENCDVIYLSIHTGGTDLPELQNSLDTGIPIAVDFSEIGMNALVDLSRQSSNSLGQIVKRGDFFIANSENYDLVLGMLASKGRVNSAVYDADHSLQNFIAVDTNESSINNFLGNPLRAADFPEPLIQPPKNIYSNKELVEIYLREGGLPLLFTHVWRRMKRILRQKVGLK